MSTIKLEETFNQGRREALKKFGRYAAAVPTAMILLQPDVSHADKGRGRGWGRGGKSKRRRGGRDHY